MGPRVWVAEAAEAAAPAVAGEEDDEECAINKGVIRFRVENKDKGENAVVLTARRSSILSGGIWRAGNETNKAGFRTHGTHPGPPFPRAEKPLIKKQSEHSLNFKF